MLTYCQTLENMVGERKALYELNWYKKKYQKMNVSLAAIRN